MESGKIPEWMLWSSYRDREGMELSRQRLYMRLLLFLTAFFSVLAVATEHLFPAAFHMPVLAAGAAAFTAMVRAGRESTTPIVIAVLVAAISLNCFMTLLVANIQTYSSEIALGEVILFTGLAVLLTLARIRRKLPALVKAGVMVIVILLFIASLQSASESNEETPKLPQLWLSVALGPMVFLTFMTFLVLIAYPRGTVTMPPQKWE